MYLPLTRHGVAEARLFNPGARRDAWLHLCSPFVSILHRCAYFTNREYHRILGTSRKRSDSDVKADSDSQRQPRIHGNTAALIDAFTAGAEAAGHTVARFDLAALDIHGCRGCLGGARIRHPCVQRDGMDAVYPAYMAADVVVLASPMYYWSISGQLKCAL